MKPQKYGKSLLCIILMAALLSSLWLSAAEGFMSGQSTAGAKADYVTFEGVAGNDYYQSIQHSYCVNQWAGPDGGVTGYPMSSNGWPLAPGANDTFYTATKSLRVGMTSYGELCTQNNTGIAYGASKSEWDNTESWASTAINPAYYVQGWLLYLNYSRFYVQRQLEAYALFSDTSTPESARKVYSWDGFQTATENGTGTVPTGGITSGSLVPSGVQVLYDSARLAVARTTVVIIDGFYNEAVAQVTFTLIFQKDTKYCIVLKDVKIVLDPKVMIQINDFVFQEKYEIDLARLVNPQNAAFVHYFANNFTSVYQHPLTGTTGCDVVQAFDPSRQYLFFAGYWPKSTDYAVSHPLVPILGTSPYATRILPSNEAVGTHTTQADIGAPIGEPNTPIVTVQWNYTQISWPHMLQFLAKAPNREIRFVEVPGMTDYNMDPVHALDVNASDPINQVDTEIMYFMHQVFNPEDLASVGAYPTIRVNGWDTGRPALWDAVGQGASSTDSLGASVTSTIWSDSERWTPIGLLDTDDNGRLGNNGTIPYGIANMIPGPYVEYFSNSGKGTGIDATTFMRLGLIGFIFHTYDDVLNSPPQPVSGCYANGVFVADVDQDQVYEYNSYWYPSKDPLTERWVYDITDSSWIPNTYDAINWHPNGIITVGGMRANAITRYFNDFNYAIEREGTDSSDTRALVFGGTVTGAAPTSNINSNKVVDFFPLTTWNTAGWNGNTQKSVLMSGFGYTNGYAIISVARDINNTRGITVAGWDARDTYWGSNWASQYLRDDNDHYPPGTVAIILQITYTTNMNEPTAFTVVRDLGTITEWGSNYFTTTYGYDTTAIAQAYMGWLSPTQATWTNNMAVNVGQTGSLPHYPIAEDYVWWWAKLPTYSTALVDYDETQ